MRHVARLAGIGPLIVNLPRVIRIKEKGDLTASFSAGCYGIAFLLFFAVLVLATMMVSQIYFISTDGLLLKFVLFLLFVSPYFAAPWWIERQRQQIGEIDLHLIEQTGEQMTFALLFHPHRTLHLTHIDAQLTIYEYHTSPKESDTRQTSYTIPKITYLAREESRIEQSLTLSPQQMPLTLHLSLPIPPNMPSTYEEYDEQNRVKSGISWNVTVKLGMKSWVSWEQSVLLAVIESKEPLLLT